MQIYSSIRGVEMAQATMLDLQPVQRLQSLAMYEASSSTLDILLALKASGQPHLLHTVLKKE